MIAKIVDKNIREIEPFTVILYKTFVGFEIYYKDVFVFYALFHFSFVRIQNIFYAYLNKKYLPYILKELTKHQISYVIVDARNHYHLIEKKEPSFNQYFFFYKRGRRLYKRRKQITKLMNELKQSQLGEQEMQDIYYFLKGVCHEVN